MKISPFKLERFFAKYEFNAPYLLCTSDCESLSIGELLSFEPNSSQHFQELRLGYTEACGDPILREEISKLYENMDSSNILVHSGAEEAIFTFMNSALKAGDHIIVHYPCYQSLFEIANSVGCKVTRWETKEEDGWELDLNFLKKNISKDTRAIIINCPHNPTGYLVSKDKLLDIIEIARQNNILLLSDEVYRFLEYKEQDRLPGVCDLYENGVSIGVMSKTFGLAGLRIGWIASKNKDIFNSISSFKDYTSICSSAPSEFLASLALKFKDKIINRNVGIVLKNLELLDDFFNTYKEIFTWKRPKAGSIAFPSVKPDIDVERLCIDLVDKKGVLLLPGKYYDYDSRNFRIGFGRNNVPQCIEKLDEYMKGNFNKLLS